MGEFKDFANRVSAKGRVVGMEVGRFVLFIRTDRNGRRPRREQQEAAAVTGNAQAAAVDMEQEGVKAVPVTQENTPRENTRARRRREREEPEGIYATFAYSPAMEELRPGDTVEVEGHVVAYTMRDRLWEKRFSYRQALVADKVTFCKTMLEEEFGLKAGFYMGSHAFKTALAGTVEGVSEVPGWKVLTLEIPGNAGSLRKNSIRVQYSTRARINSIDVGKGDAVALVASLVTRQKEINGERRNFENILVEDMVVVRKAASAGDIEEDAENLFSALDEEESADAATPVKEGAED